MSLLENFGRRKHFVDSKATSLISVPVFPQARIVADAIRNLLGHQDCPDRSIAVPDVTDVHCEKIGDLLPATETLCHGLDIGLDDVSSS